MDFREQQSWQPPRDGGEAPGGPEDLAKAVAGVSDALEEILRTEEGGDARLPAGHGAVGDLVDRINAVLARANRAEERQDALARELGEFAYIASHDLQEPLRIVSSFLTLLERRHGDQLDETALEYIHHAVAGARRMQDLIRDLLLYSRVTTQAGPHVEVDLDVVLSDVLRELGPRTEQLGAVIERDPLPSIRAEPQQMTQLFTQLIDNALKFGSDRPLRVMVANRSTRSAVHIEVRDTGMGIPAEQSERVFQVFQRLHPREAFPGTGIGLAICKKIVEAHDGRIWVDGIEDDGTVVHVEFPEHRLTGIERKED